MKERWKQKINEEVFRKQQKEKKKTAKRSEKNQGCRISGISLAISYKEVAVVFVGLLRSSIISQGSLFFYPFPQPRVTLLVFVPIVYVSIFGPR